MVRKHLGTTPWKKTRGVADLCISFAEEDVIILQKYSRK